jgi:hypothetical protein
VIAIKARIVRAAKIGVTDPAVGRRIGVIAAPSVVPQERREATLLEEGARQRARVVADQAESAGSFPGIVDHGRAVETIGADRDVRVDTVVIADRAFNMGDRADMVVRGDMVVAVDRIVVPTTAPTTR